MSNLRDWAGLPDGLLHSIVELLCSFPDLLAFAATCHLWRSAFSSYPSKSTLYALFPPLLLDPNVSYCSPRPFRHVARNICVPKRPCYVIDLGSQDTLICSQIPLLSIGYRNNPPPSALHKFGFTGASFGHMIFCSSGTCFLFDMFTGIEVLPPPLPVVENTEIYFFGATLTGPLASPNSHIVVCTGSSNLFWRVGSNSWSECSPRTGSLTEFVVFKGQVFGMGSARRLFMVHLTSQIHLQEIPVSWGGKNSMTQWHLTYSWLVVCGNMLLMVGFQRGFSGTGTTFEAYHLDTSTKPAKWAKVERLENWAIFISNDSRVQPVPCMNPERWGGKSNCVYCYDSLSGHSVAFKLGEPQLLGYDAARSHFLISTCPIGRVQPIWVVPSMFSVL